LKNTARLGQVRRQISQLRTIMRERELAAAAQEGKQCKLLNMASA